MRRGLVVYIVELVLVALGLVIAREIAARTVLIPNSILRLKNTPLSGGDLVDVLLVYVPIAAVVFLFYRLLAKGGVFSQPRRTVIEVYGLALVNLFGALYTFLFAQVVFSAHFHLAAAIVMAVLFIAAYAVWPRDAAPDGAAQPNRAVAFGQALLRYSLSWGAVAVVVVALAPVGLTIEYKRNDALKDLIISFKVGLQRGPATDWHLENALSGVSFRQPIAIDFAPEGDQELYVLERHGKVIRVTDDGGGFTKEDLVDFSDAVGKVSGENGAQGIALHPRFGSENSYVYVYYTHVTPGAQRNRLSRFDLSLGDAAAVRDSEFVLMELGRSTGGSHNGGTVAFGPDGFLYLSIGDGADSANHLTIERSLFGGIHRIDVDQQGGDISHPIRRQPLDGTTQGYFIPNDNPFAGQDVMEEFWAVGLRNPFRMSFDPEDGSLWTGDVGFESFEEINKVVGGGNYGWPFLEGLENTMDIATPDPMIGELQAPFYFYGHTANDRAVISGVVYRGPLFPELEGQLILADNFSGKMRAIPVDGREIAVTELVQIDQVNQSGITSMTETPSGEIYVTTLGRFDAATGIVSRLAPGPAEDRKIQDAVEVAAITEVSDAAALELYAVNCSQCHGPAGAGDGETLEGTDNQPPDFRTAEWQASRTDDDILLIIRQGGEAAGLSNAMPPWEGALQDTELERLVDVLRGFAEG